MLIDSSSSHNFIDLSLVKRIRGQLDITQYHQGHIGLALYQTKLNIIRVILSLYVLWVEHFGKEQSMNLLYKCYRLRNSLFQVSLFYLIGSIGNVIEKNPSIHKSWRKYWFFTTRKWELSASDLFRGASVMRRFTEKDVRSIGMTSKCTISFVKMA